MRNSLTLLAAGAALLGAPAIAQVGGVVGGTVDTTAQVGTGAVGSTVGNVTGQLGNSVDRADGAVNGAIDSARLTAATREQVRAGAQITDAARAVMHAEQPISEPTPAAGRAPSQRRVAVPVVDHLFS